MPPLPIEAVLPALGRALSECGQAVLRAPPGAGKTTRVPIHLLDAGLVSGRILMLEPRRVAARAAAERLASMLDERPGERVGYRMRGETVPGRAIEVVTEGVLTRMLQREPDLPGIGCVIFDEFHERALQADLGLALTIETRAVLRTDLRLLVMSATLDAEPVADLLGGAPVVTAEGRTYPVETRWLDRPWRARGGSRREAAIADLTLTALAATEGGVLVFLPGRTEIGRTAAALQGRLPAGVALQTLHGGLALAEQRAALGPLTRGRKLVLATAIAETSLTIPDVRTVVDGGLARRARFDPGSGMTRLVTERVTRAEAEQRRGRAGRVGPGWCYRLWTRGEEGGMAPFAPPEIASADLTGLALELALWGVRGTDGLAFLTPVPEAAFAEARALLYDLGALDAGGAITAHGREMAGLPAHPRLAHMLLAGGAHPAAEIAAILEARDPLRVTAGRPPTDLALRLAALADPKRAEADHPVSVDRTALAAIRGDASRLARLAGRAGGIDTASAGGLLSLAYPDRIALRRPGSAPRYLLASGKGAVLPADDPLAGDPMIVAADLDGDPREALIRRALSVSEAEIRDLHGARLRHERKCFWSRRDRAVLARERLMLGALALEDRPWTDASPEAMAEALTAGIRERGLDTLPWTSQSRRLVARIEWLRNAGEAMPDFSDEALLDGLDQWFGPYLAGKRRIEDIASADLSNALAMRLGRDAQARLEQLAPAAIKAPTGTRLPVDYSGPAPQIAVRLQEMFGLTRHPTVGPDRRPLVIALLSPAGRPVQTTSDLSGFWTRSYPDVRRDLRGRYPRHAWPDDPVAAAPTRRAKPRGKRAT